MSFDSLPQQEFFFSLHIETGSQPTALSSGVNLLENKFDYSL
jgi:hypothetical protein